MEMVNRKTILKKSLLKTLQSFKMSLPIMIGILLLINLINIVAKGHYSKLFTGNLVLDPLIEALAGSLSFGIPITSYIVGGELLREGVSLLAIAAFLTFGYSMYLTG